MITIVRSIIKNYGHFFRCTVFQITYCMPSTSRFTCIMRMISKFTTCFIFSIFIFKFFCTNIERFAFSYDSCCSFANNLTFFILKFILFIALLRIPIFLSCNLYFCIYIMFLFVSLHDDIVDLKKPDGMLTYFRYS